MLSRNTKWRMFDQDTPCVTGGVIGGVKTLQDTRPGQYMLLAPQGQDARASGYLIHTEGPTTTLFRSPPP